MRKHLPQLCLWFVTCLAGVLPAASAVAQPAEIIAVFDTDSSDTSIDEATMTRLNNYMFGRLAVAGFKLTPQSQVRERVVELKAASHMDCYDQSCQIELGKTVAAQKSLASRLIKIGDSCSLQAVIYDLRTETTDKGAEAQGPCTETGIKASIDRVVANFKGEAVSSAPISAGRVETGQVFDRGADIVNEPTEESGFLIIHSNPSGATISINGKEVGQTPQHLEYSAGRYIVVAELGRLYHPARQEVVLTKQGARVILDLKPAFGSAKITSSPSKAEVWLDGESVGRTPLEISQKLSGTYSLRLLSPDYLPSEGELVIQDGKEAQYHGELSPNWGRIRVESDPPGAFVYLNDVLAREFLSGDKTTPCELGRVKPGVHVVKISLAGHGERREKVSVERGETASVSAKLQPMLGRLVVTSSYFDGVVCEGDLKIDGKLMGQTPWLGDVLAVPHKIEVHCPNGNGSQEVVVVHNSRAEVNVSVETCREGWCLIPGGTFLMGSDNGAVFEKPVHSVTVASFEMSKTEVTVDQYRACVNAGACTAPDTTAFAEFTSCNWGKSDRGNHPVNCVNWYQAQAYAKWVGGRLPSEAEWEYAARSGGRDWKYPWGNAGATCDLVVMDNDGVGCGRDSTWPVCSKPKGNTAHGLCDMAGNVAEWVQDWDHENYQGAPTNGSAWESPAGRYRVTRGGSAASRMLGVLEIYSGDVWTLQTTCRRVMGVPSDGASTLGFRVARSVR